MPKTEGLIKIEAEHILAADEDHLKAA